VLQVDAWQNKMLYLTHFLI